MNVLQSYEMQSLLRPGDVVVDVGANLGRREVEAMYGRSILSAAIILAICRFLQSLFCSITCCYN